MEDSDTPERMLYCWRCVMSRKNGEGPGELALYLMILATAVSFLVSGQTVRAASRFSTDMNSNGYSIVNEGV